jgi:predicted outer membrane protein
MKPVHLMLAISGLLLTPMAGAQGSGQKSLLTAAEQRILIDASMDVRLELDLSKLAFSNTTSAMVRAKATTYIDNYMRILADIRIFATANKVDLPADLDAAHLRIYARVRPLRTADFDTVYMSVTETMNLRIKSEFTSLAAHAQTKSVFTFARQELAVLADIK